MVRGAGAAANGKSSLVHIPSTHYGVHTNDSTNTVIVGHGYVAFVHSRKHDVDCTAWDPLLVDVLNGKTAAVINITNDV